MRSRSGVISFRVSRVGSWGARVFRVGVMLLYFHILLLYVTVRRQGHRVPGEGGGGNEVNVNRTRGYRETHRTRSTVYTASSASL